MEEKKLIIIILIVGVALFFLVYVGIDFIYDNKNTPNSEKRVEFGVYEKKTEEDLGEIRQELQKINTEVVDTAQKYFEDIDFHNFRIYYENMSWAESFYSDGDREINMGIFGVEGHLERYKLAFTHEYMHYILHRYGLEESELHEGLADVYTIFLNREEQAEIFGKKNQERGYPYDIFSNQILEYKKFNCLYKVFDEDNKIDEVEDMLDRLEKECNVEW